MGRDRQRNAADVADDVMTIYRSRRMAQSILIPLAQLSQLDRWGLFEFSVIWIGLPLLSCTWLILLIRDLKRPWGRTPPRGRGFEVLPPKKSESE